MNYSISTVSGKTKLKIIMLGSMGVGKSSIIDRYINDHFDLNYNVSLCRNRPLSELIFWLKMFPITPKITVYSFGTRRGSSVSVR